MVAKIERERLLMDIWGLYRWLGRVPTIQDYREYGRYSQRPIYSQFDGWVDARSEAGVFDRSLVDVTKQDLIERLQWLYEKLGREPKIQDYKEHITENTEPFYRYGGFEAVKKDAGVWEGGYGNESREISRLDIVRDMRRTANRVDGPLSVDKYQQYGNISTRTILNKFGSFVAAREATGLESESLLYRTAEDHPNYTHGVGKDIYKRAAFDRNKVKARKRDDYECQNCGLTLEEHVEKWGRALHVHHVLPTWLVEPDDDSIHVLSNLVTLCRECHHGLYDNLFTHPRELKRLGGGSP